MECIPIAPYHPPQRQHAPHLMIYDLEMLVMLTVAFTQYTLHSGTHSINNGVGHSVYEDAGDQVDVSELLDSDEA
jgi:hypothetical protein